MKKTEFTPLEIGIIVYSISLARTMALFKWDGNPTVDAPYPKEKFDDAYFSLAEKLGGAEYTDDDFRKALGPGFDVLRRAKP